MKCKNPTRQRNYFCLLFMLLKVSGISQESNIEKTLNMPFMFYKNGMITDLKSKMNFIDSNNVQIYLINMYGQVQSKMEGFYLSIDSNNCYKILGLNADTIFLSRKFEKSENDDFDFQKKQHMPIGYFVSRCDYVVSSHKLSALYVYHNATSRWVECTSFDGHMEESLCANKAHDYLHKCYELIRKICKENEVDVKQ